MRRVRKLGKKTRGIWKRYNREEIRKQLKVINLDEGGHTYPTEKHIPKEEILSDEYRLEELKDNGEIGTCVNEAAALVSGQSHTDHPICMSDVITHIMIEANDMTHDLYERNKLKDLIPDVLGTAPVKIVKAGAVTNIMQRKRLNLKKDDLVEVKDKQDPLYKKLEKARLAEWKKLSGIRDNRFNGLDYNSMNVDQYIDKIHQVLAVKVSL